MSVHRSRFLAGQPHPGAAGARDSSGGMLKEAQIPFFLWLPAAMLFHFMTGGASVQAAKVLSERADILAFSRAVRSDVRESLLMTVEFAPGQGDDTPEEPPPEPADDTSDQPDPDAEQETPEVEKIPAPLPQAQQPPKTAPPKLPQPEPEEPEKKVAVAPPPPPEPKEDKPPEPKPEPEKKPEDEAKKAEKKDEPQRIELPKPDGRIAVQNDPSLAKDQEDNPNANRIADHANRVKEETMARFRSYDQNTSKPTGGGQPTPSPIREPGNAPDHQRGFSHQVEGSGDPKPGSENGPDDPPKEPIARSQQGSNAPIAGQEGIKGVKGVEGRAEQPGPSPEPVTGADGGWSISADDDAKAQKGRKGRKAVAGRAAIPGVPMPGALPQQYSINAFGLVDALGKEHLREEQEKARNTRLSRHRGSFKANEFQKYRAAIENYDPSVKPGNQTSLNAARVPFASYINMMHNRIHPIFADGFLGSLGKLDADDKLNNLKLATHMELVLDGETGAVVRAGIVRGSGVTAFDVAALSSAKSAGPFGKAPDVIVSPDGKVYVHWEFYRDPYFACTSKFARPYLIKAPPKGDDAETPPGPRPNDGGKENRTAEGQAPLRPTKK